MNQHFKKTRARRIFQKLQLATKAENT